MRLLFEHGFCGANGVDSPHSTWREDISWMGYWEIWQRFLPLSRSFCGNHCLLPRAFLSIHPASFVPPSGNEDFA